MTTSVYEPHPTDGKYCIGKVVKIVGRAIGDTETREHFAPIYLMWTPNWAWIKTEGFPFNGWHHITTLDRWN